MGVNESVEIMVIDYFGLDMDQKHGQLNDFFSLLRTNSLQRIYSFSDKFIYFNGEVDIVGLIVLYWKQSHDYTIKMIVKIVYVIQFWPISHLLFLPTWPIDLVISIFNFLLFLSIPLIDCSFTFAHLYVSCCINLFIHFVIDLL